ncbi:uncharacterized protein LOC110978529 [Acanthaster planci]|uniref:Uncharacterized protein LOC110978529 n=1 Tax=Acanthaster planci TaxID=133434 RepID=A0A8B7Y7T4_ACAPL|nr:uncharacterized protein LOC110978529 [Acanthaster planci]
MELCHSLLAHVVLFNRRRSGETERLLLGAYEKVETNRDLQPEVFNSLGEVEKVLVQKLKRIEVRGKRGRKVPILLTREMVESIDFLNAARSSAGISPNNPYVFGRAFCDSTLPTKASECLRKFAVLCRAEQPSTLRSTKLRKHIATMSQLLSLKENELDMLAGYMGHDVRIHREFYRLPENTLQLAKVSKVLIMMEKGETAKFKGKSLDDIDIALDDVDSDSSEPDTRKEERERPMPEGDREYVEPDEEGQRPTPEGDRDNVEPDEEGQRPTPEAVVDLPSTNCSKDRHKHPHQPHAKKKQQSCVPPSRKKQKTCLPWETDEKDFISSFFADNFCSGKPLRKVDCLKAQDNHPALKRRHWSHIKDYVIAETKRRRRDASKH